MQAHVRNALPVGLALLVASALGCSSGQIAAPTQPATQPVTQLADDTAAAPERSVLSLDDAPSPDQILKNLPQRISVADANRLLVKIDPNQIQDDNKNYQVMQHRGGRMGSFHGNFRGHGFRFHHGFHNRFFRNRAFFNNFLFFPFSNFYFPYFLYSGYYYPYYLYNSLYYYPMLYGYGGLYNPYYYTSPLAWWGRY
jgi:hypothetical protein